MNWRPPLCFANTGHILRRDTRALSPHCPKIVPVTIWSSRSCSSLRIRTICSRQGLGRATLKQKWREWNKIETVGVCETSMGRSLHNLSPSLGLACKSFLISASKYICSLTDPTTLVTVGPLTPAGHLAIPLLWGKLFRQKFCVFTYFGSLSLHYISKAIISLLRLLVWRGWHSATLLKHLWPRLIFFSYFFLPARSFAFLETTIYIWVLEVCKTGQGRFGV